MNQTLLKGEQNRKTIVIKTKIDIHVMEKIYSHR